jgi:hypothetical protein
VKNIGIRDVFIGNQIPHALHLPNRMKEKDEASQIAKRLGYRILSIDNSRKSISEDELYFLATNYPKYYRWPWSEVSFHGMAKYIESHCSTAVVFTGHHGDAVWDVNLPDDLLNAQRRAHSLIGYCQEMRLKAGFINIPVPIIEMANIKDIVSISRSPEMAPWRLNNNYDRPIARRIAEDAGVPRHLFGQKKKFIANIYLWPINPILRKKFFRHIKTVYNISARIIYLEYIIQYIFKLPVFNVLQVRMRSRSKKGIYFFLKKNIDIYYLMVHWAVDVLTEKFSKITKLS